jgi:hypothetical protein
MGQKTVPLSLGLVLSFSTLAHSSYIFTNPPTLVTRSELIVKGVVAELRGESFTFEVQRVVRGSLPGQGTTVVVARFKDWVCATRWAPYAPGQHLILFLERLRSSEPALWRIMGAGGEGEVVIDGDIAHFHTPEGVSERCFDLTGGRFCGDAAPLDEFLAAVGEYAHLYQWRRDTATIIQVATNPEVEAFAARSSFRARLVKLTHHPGRAWSKR